MANAQLSGEELLRHLEQEGITNAEMVRVLEEDYGVEVDEAIKERKDVLRRLLIETLTGKPIPDHLAKKIEAHDEARKYSEGPRGEAYRKGRGAFVHKAGGGPKR